MSAPVPPSLKALKPYLQHAKQTKKVDPIMSYYCSYYAVTLGIESNPSNPEDKGFLLSLLDQLDVEKQSLKHLLSQPENQAHHVLQFSNRVFMKADEEDRAGQASKATARAFYAASIFFNTLKQFGELDEEVQGKLKYAKWKAADITTALREGRKPSPGPAKTEEEELAEFEKSLAQEMNQGLPPTSQQQPDVYHSNQAPGYQENVPQHQPPPIYSPAAQNVYSQQGPDQGTPTGYNEIPIQRSEVGYGAPPQVADNFSFSASDYPSPPTYNENIQPISSNAYSGSFSEADFPATPTYTEDAPPPFFNTELGPPPSSYPSEIETPGILNYEAPQHIPQQLPPLHTPQHAPQYDFTRAAPTNPQGTFVNAYSQVPETNQYNAAPIQTKPAELNFMPPPSVQKEPNYSMNIPQNQKYNPPVRQQQQQQQQPLARSFHNSKPLARYSGEPDLSGAYRYSRFAVSALQFEDVPAAIENLKNSLIVLGIHVP